MCQTFSGLITKRGCYTDIHGDQHHSTMLSEARCGSSDFRPNHVPVECIPVGETLTSDSKLDWKTILDGGLTNNDLPAWCPREYADPMLEEFRDHVIKELKSVNWKQRFERVDLSSKSVRELPSGLIVGELQLNGCVSLKKLPPSLVFNRLNLRNDTRLSRFDILDVKWQDYCAKFNSRARAKGVEIERLVEVMASN